MLKKRKINFSFGTVGLFLTRQFRFELVYFRYIRKIIRKKYRKKKITFSKQKYWIRFNKNIIITKKSKNSRMGSGKGAYLRSAFNIAPNKAFIETKNINAKYVKNIGFKLQYKIPFFFKTLLNNYKSFYIK